MKHKLYTRRAAKRIAARAHGHHVPKAMARDIADACRKYHLPYSIGFATVEQESFFRNVYGHDSGGLNPGDVVTKHNFEEFRRRVVSTNGGGANGVGPLQITYWTYIRDHPRLYKQRVNIFVGIKILADLVHRLGEFNGIGAYNGGEGNPNEAYAAEVLDRVKKWRPRLRGSRKPLRGVK